MGGGHDALEFDHEDKKRKKMVVIFFSDRWKIIFLEMEKFQWWITKRYLDWVWYVNVSSLLSVRLSPIQLLMKEFLQAIT